MSRSEKNTRVNWPAPENPRTLIKDQINAQKQVSWRLLEQFKPSIVFDWRTQNAEDKMTSILEVSTFKIQSPHLKYFFHAYDFDLKSW